MCKFLKRIRHLFTHLSLENLFSSILEDHELQGILYGAYERKAFDREYTRMDNGWRYVVYSESNRDYICLFEIADKNGHYTLRTLLPFELSNSNAQVNAEVSERLSGKSGYGYITQEQSSYGKIRYYLVQPLNNLSPKLVKGTLRATLNEFLEELRPELAQLMEELSDEAALIREHSEDDDDEELDD